MTFMESAIAMNTDFVECHNALGKIGLFAEASYNDYQINLKEIALKVLKENGTEDDYNFLATEAAKDYIERAKKAISKIIQTIIKFIRDCKNKLVSLFTSEKTSKAIDKLEEACDKNPKLRSKKIDYEDTDKQVKAIQKGVDSIKKKVAKVEARGYATEDDLTSLDDIARETTKKVAAVGAASAITIGAAVVLLKKFRNKEDIDAALGNEEDQISQPKDGIANDPTTANFFVKSVQKISTLLKDKAHMIVAAPVSLLNKIKGKSASEKIDTDSDEETKTESVNFEDLPMFKIVTEKCDDDKDIGTEETEESVETESTMTLGEVEGLDLDAYFTELCDDLFTESEEESNDTTTEDTTDVEESDETETTETEEEVEESTDDVQSDAALYLEQLENEILGSDEDVVEEETNDITDEDLTRTYMEQLEHELFGDSEDVVQEETDDTTDTEESTAEETTSDETSTEESDESVETESTTDVDDVYKSLLDEMEALLDD